LHKNGANKGVFRTALPLARSAFAVRVALARSAALSPEGSAGAEVLFVVHARVACEKTPFYLKLFQYTHPEPVLGNNIGSKGELLAPASPHFIKYLISEFHPAKTKPVF